MPGHDPHPDPFVERERLRAPISCQILGGRFHFESSSAELLQLVRWAYARLPQHRVSAQSPHFVVRLALNSATKPAKRGQPQELQLMGGGGLLGGVAGSGSFVALSPDQRSALVAVSPQLLTHPYYARYELIEFAVFTLAARAQRLVPLHAACISLRNRGVLVMGSSGTGKSTLSLHCLQRQLDFVAEDAVFVEPGRMLATGVANFLHLCPETLLTLAPRLATALRASPSISRRSGIRKYEVDLRGSRYQLAAQPPLVSAMVFLSRRPGGKTLLRPLSTKEIHRKLVAAQPYAAAQPEWEAFVTKATSLGGYELRRGKYPQAGAELIHELLAAGG